MQPNARGRPRKYSDEILVDAALRVMEREGYGALTIRSLAAELGTSHTTLYNYVGAIEEIEDKAVHRLADRMPLPRSASAIDLRAQLKDFLTEGRRLLLQHPGVMLSHPESPAARTFAEIGERWHRALLPHAPDSKSVQLAMGALMSTVLLAVESERLHGPDFDRKHLKAAKRTADSIAHYSVDEYIDAMIDFVLPGLTSGSQGKKFVKRGRKGNE